MEDSRKKIVHVLAVSQTAVSLSRRAGCKGFQKGRDTLYCCLGPVSSWSEEVQTGLCLIAAVPKLETVKKLGNLFCQAPVHWVISILKMYC